MRILDHMQFIDGIAAANGTSNAMPAVAAVAFAPASRLVDSAASSSSNEREVPT